MRRSLLLLTALAGCDVAPWCEPHFADPDERLDVDTLRAAYDEWISWAGAGRVCVERVTVGLTVDNTFTVENAVGVRIVVDPNAADPAHELRAALCVALDEREGLLASDPTVYAAWTPRSRGFVSHCADGPHAWDLIDVTERACGASQDLDEQRFLAARVYPQATVSRPDALTLTAGATVRLDESAGSVAEIAGLGDKLLIVRSTRADTGGTDTRATYTAELLDPALAPPASIPLLTRTAATLSRVLYTGPDAAVLLLDDGAVTTAWTITPDGTATSRTVDVPLAWPGAVGGRTLFLADTFPGTIQTLDLTTGAVGAIAVPATPHDLVLDALVGVPGGLVAAIREARIGRTGSGLSIDATDTVLTRYDAATATWTELTRGLAGAPVGLATDGLLVGGYAAWAPSNPGGAVAGAWDLAEGRLLASSDLCTHAEGPPLTVSAGMGWWAGRDDEGLFLNPFAVEVE
jgi:hypothetical protein